MVQCGRRSFCQYTRLIWFLWWLNAAAPFAGLFVYSSVVREHGRDGNLHQSQQDFRPVSSLLGFPLWCFFSLALFCGVLYDAGAAHLPFLFDLSWLYCRFVSCVSCVLAYREANLAHIIVRFPYCLSVGCLVCMC